MGDCLSFGYFTDLDCSSSLTLCQFKDGPYCILSFLGDGHVMESNISLSIDLVDIKHELLCLVKIFLDSSIVTSPRPGDEPQSYPCRSLLN